MLVSALEAKGIAGVPERVPEVDESFCTPRFKPPNPLSPGVEAPEAAPPLTLVLVGAEGR